MPLALSHEALLDGAVFQIPNQVVSWPSLTTLRGSTASSTRATWISVRCSVGWRWVVRWAWLEADGLVGVEVACYSLNCLGNSALLYLHGRGSLSPRTHGLSCGLRIQALLLLLLLLRLLLWRPSIWSWWHLCRSLLHHAHLVIRSRLLLLLWIWGRCNLVVRVWRIHAIASVVDWRLLGWSALRVLAHCRSGAIRCGGG